MEHTLQISISEEIYETIKKEAEQKGQSLEELVSDWLADRALESASDPLDKLVGILSLNNPGWSDRHDLHIGESLLDSVRGKSSDDEG